jgi:hypothetical protein
VLNDGWQQAGDESFKPEFDENVRVGGHMGDEGVAHFTPISSANY